MATEIRSYSDLVDVLRRRKQELDIAFATIETISGLQDGYVSKLMSPRPSKLFGELSLTLILETLCLRIIVVEDDEALARLRPRLVPRYHAGDAHQTVSHGRRSRAQPAPAPAA